MVDPVTATLSTYSYVAIVIFLLVVILIIRPVTIRIGRRIKIYLNIATVPPLGVLILLLCRAIDIDVVAIGFLGSFGVQPWAILILFYSLVEFKQSKKTEFLSDPSFLSLKKNRHTFAFRWT